MTIEENAKVITELILSYGVGRYQPTQDISVDVIAVGDYFTSLQVFYLKELVLEVVSYCSTTHDVSRFVDGQWVGQLAAYYLKRSLASPEISKNFSDG